MVSAKASGRGTDKAADQKRDGGEDREIGGRLAGLPVRITLVKASRAKEIPGRITQRADRRDESSPDLKSGLSFYMLLSG